MDSALPTVNLLSAPPSPKTNRTQKILKNFSETCNLLPCFDVYIDRKEIFGKWF